MAKRITFTGEKLRKLALPTQRRTYVYDADVRGLALEMTAPGQSPSGFTENSGVAQ